MNSLVEKFEILMPPKPETDHEWAAEGSQFSKGEAGFLHSNNAYADTESGAKFNMLPPGPDIDNQRRKRIEGMPLVMAGKGDVSNVVTYSGFTKGYTRQTMRGTDDLYSGEHIDQFYGEVIDEEGNEGFCERNNLCDRI